MSLMGSAVVPLCLVLIGLSLAYYGMPDALGGAVAIAAIKLLVVPAVVLVVVEPWLVVAAATPVGVLIAIFAAEYKRESEFISTAIVLSTALSPIFVTAWIIATRLI